MVLYTGEYYPTTGEYEVLCEACSVVVGKVTRAEAAELTVKCQKVLCFDCEGFWSDTIPEHLTPQGDVIIIRSAEAPLVIFDWDDRIVGKPFKPISEALDFG